MISETAVGSPQPSVSWARDALASAKSPKARQAAQVVTVAAAGWEIGRKVYGYARGRVAYTVSVPGTDEAYDLVSSWLTDRVASRARRSLSVTTRRRSFDPSEVSSNDSGGTPAATASMRVDYDGSRAQTVRIGRHRVSVKVDRSGLTEGLNLSVNTSSDASWERSMRQITFTGYGVAARDAVIDLLAELTAAARHGAERRPRMLVARRWGDWQRIRDVPPRRLETVILVDGQAERVIDDLERFMAADHLYARVGVPWHRGYLFHGPPGCGKTSFATAIAGRFGLDVYLLPLSDLDADVNLVALLGQVDPGSVLVIEDIDVVHAAKARDDAERKGITLSGLLNALDGLITPHGLVTIMTTNRIEDLDPALVRPGRADLVEWFGPLDDGQAARLAALVDPDGEDSTPFPVINGAMITHAELLEAAKPHLAAPWAASKAMRERLWQALATTPVES